MMRSDSYLHDGGDGNNTNIMDDHNYLAFSSHHSREPSFLQQQTMERNNNNNGTAAAAAIAVNGNNNNDLMEFVHKELITATNWMGTLLDQAEQTLQELEEDDSNLLGTAIIRKCQEGADALDALAKELQEHVVDTFMESSSDENKITIEVPRLENHSHYYSNPQMQTIGPSSSVSPSHSIETVSSPTSTTEITTATNQQQQPQDHQTNVLVIDIQKVSMAIMYLLNDTASSLRMIASQDADEIARVALTLADMTIQNLYDVQDQLVQALQDANVASVANDGSNNNAYSTARRSTVTIEELSSSSSPPPATENNNTTTESPTTSSTTTRSPIDLTTTSNRDVPSEQLIRRRRRRRPKRRQRVLWPPLKPIVCNAYDWTREHVVQEQPPLVLAAGIGLTWPILLSTAWIGGSIVLVDEVLQHVYNNVLHDAIKVPLEQSAAQLVQATQLSWLVTKITTKQSLHIVQAQLERHGLDNDNDNDEPINPVNHIAGQVGGFVMDRITHPIDTIGMTWNGIVWGWDRVTETIHHVMEQHQDQTVAEQLY